MSEVKQVTLKPGVVPRLMAGKELPALLEQVEVITAKAQEDRFATVTMDNAEKAVELLARLRAAAREVDAKAKCDIADISKEIADKLKEIEDIKAASLSWRKKIDGLQTSLADGLVKIYESNVVNDGVSVAKRLTGVLGSRATFVPEPTYSLKPMPTQTETAVRIVVGQMLEISPIFLLPPEQWVNWAEVEKAYASSPMIRDPGVVVGTTHTITTRAAELVS